MAVGTEDLLNRTPQAGAVTVHAVVGMRVRMAVGLWLRLSAMNVARSRAQPIMIVVHVGVLHDALTPV
jgi:hypothetical protein